MSLLNLYKTMIIILLFFAKSNMDHSYIASPFLGTHNILKYINES